MIVGSDIEKAASFIKNGGLVAFPTETVYGLGANALNPYAVAKIFEVKKRPSFDPLIVHICNRKMMYELSNNVPILAEILSKAFWPGPLTLVMPKNSLVPDIVTSGLSTVGIRMPNNDIALKLIEASSCPIAAPSANRFGKTSPTKVAHVQKQLMGIDYVLDGGSTKTGIESTVVSVLQNECLILRPGTITLEDIQSVVPKGLLVKKLTKNTIHSPGMLKSHYAPQKPLLIINNFYEQLPEGSGLIVHKELMGTKHKTCKVIYTSKTNDLKEVASNLFSSFYEMDADPTVKQIFIEPVVESGIGVAIMDRIKKASFNSLKGYK